MVSVSQAAAIAVPGLFQLRAHGGVIEDFAVVDDPQAAVLVGHRLLASGQVDDAQAAMAQMSPSVLMVTEGIGTAMLQHRCHALYDGGLRIAGTARYKACDPAHAAIIASCRIKTAARNRLRGG